MIVVGFADEGKLTGEVFAGVRLGVNEAHACEQS